MGKHFVQVFIRYSCWQKTNAITMNSNPLKRALIFTIQPPGTSGVQGVRYNKILPFMEKHGWNLHFVGPSPASSSIYFEPVHRSKELCHYTSRVSLSRRFSIIKNRQKSNFLAYLFFGFIQLFFILVERLIRFDAFQYLQKGMISEAIAADSEYDFQIIAGISPDFGVLETAWSVSKRLRKPLVAIYHDPYGHREVDIFRPAEKAKQQAILEDSVAAVFASPLTRQRYIDQGLVAKEKCFWISDSYPVISLAKPGSETSVSVRRTKEDIKIIYFGNLPYYRPLDSFLEALEGFQNSNRNARLELSIYGYLDPGARKTISGSSLLSRIIKRYPWISNVESHELAERADLLLVVIGPRHTDNLPSKFFEYLCHPKPVLVIGPKQNPLEPILRELQIGEYSDITSSEDIRKGITQILECYEDYQEAYNTNHALIANYAASETAGKWADFFNRALLKGDIG